MSAPATAKTWTYGKASTPRRITLLGDKYAKPESAQHIIEFPGGAIELSRTDDGHYWAHIIVNHGFDQGDGDGLTSARGTVLAGRIDRDWSGTGCGVEDVPGVGSITQIAVLIGKVEEVEGAGPEGVQPETTGSKGEQGTPQGDLFGGAKP